MSDWQVGDLAVCVLPVGDLDLGRTYVVSDLPGVGSYRRDGMRGIGLTLGGISPPDGCSGFDPRRFIKAPAHA